MSSITGRIPIDQMVGGHRLTGHIDLALDLQPPAIEPPPKQWDLEVEPGRTIQSIIDIAKPDETIFIPDSTYYETLRIKTPRIRILTETAGGAFLSDLWREAFEGNVNWRNEGGGTYSAEHDSRPYLGSYGGVMLFPYRTRGDLEAEQVQTSMGTVKKPDYGYAFEGGRVYLRLSGGENPTGAPVKLCNAFARPLIRLDDAPNVSIDGLGVVGAGNADAVIADRASHSLHLKNIRSRHNRRLAAISDDATVEWCDYAYDGMYNFVDDLIDLNGENAGAIFKLAKGYFVQGGNALLEGGICEQAEGRSSRNCEFRFNHIHQCFDGMRMGAFHESKAHHNVFNHCYDDAIEFEHWRKSSPTSKNEVYENLILNPGMSAFSHQDSSGGGMKGPHYVYRNVVWITDPRHSHPPYLIKNRKLPADTKVFYWNNVLMNARGRNPGWGWTNQIWWRDDGKNDQRPENITLRNNILVMPGGMTRGGPTPDADGNVLVNDVDYVEARGQRGVYAGRSIGAIGFADVDKLDFSLIEKSIAIGRGVPLEAWWPKSDTYAGRDEDAGVFPAGEVMPKNWPRPRELTFSRGIV